VLLALLMGMAGALCAQSETVQYGNEDLARDYSKSYKITIKSDKEVNTPVTLYSYLFGELNVVDNTTISKGKAIFSKNVPSASKSDPSSLIPKGFYKLVCTDAYAIIEEGGESASYNVEYGTSILLNQQTAVDLSVNRGKQEFEVLNSDENKILFTTERMMVRYENFSEAFQAGVELNSSAPQSFYAKYLSLNKEIVDAMLSASFRFADIPITEFHRIRSMADFTDGRLCHSESLLFPMIRYYLTSNVLTVDEVIAEVDTILVSAARGGRYQCGLYAQWLFNIFSNTNDPYYEPVMLHIYDTYDRGWIPEDQERRIKRQMDRIRRLALGAQIPELTAYDIDGKQHSTNEIKTKYTVLWFWDPDCDHCQEMTPKLHELYQKQADTLNFEVFAVEVNNDYERWKSFSKKHGLDDWINLSTSMGEASVDFIDYFDIVTTPVILLIDNEKNHAIIARQSTLEEIVHLMK